ncbi:TetR/AcrR family transcriptional regulator [Marinitenerispora sediminis]|uniref:TetR/AcrR family transcriptional regulator n=1 Tax=Marinitenerispora sediminis TaxID=1931232 RepID=UPI001F3429F4|nr:TetR family transcriptional regulator [Marinitenerispora sediminis]
MTARRDPHGRRQRIIEAAAELIVESGPADLTHRRVAARAEVPLGATTYYFASLDELTTGALEYLADQVEAGLNELADQIAAGGGDPAAVAAIFAAYLDDSVQVRTDAALYLAGIHRPALRPLARRWLDGLTQVLSAYTAPEAARSVAVFVDGATLYALLHDAPLDLDSLTRAVAALMTATDRTDWSPESR